MKQKGLQLIVCEDGSHTLFLPELNETYHSTKGAIPESLHVYIENGYRQSKAEGEIQILEIGYGTGLNALLTAIEAEATQRKTVYHSLEPFPLPASVWSGLNYGKLLANENIWQALNNSAWNQLCTITQCFDLYKEKVKLEEVIVSDGRYDLVYFDGFAPNKQSEIWNPENLEKLHRCMKSGARMVTYSAKAQLRRDLNALGFEAGLVKGPPGKKEMIVAIKK